MANCGHASKAKPSTAWRQQTATKAVSLGQGRLWQSPPNPSFIQPIESIQSIGSIASIHPGKSNILFWSCLLCSTSLTLPPSSLICLQKKQSEQPHKVFQVFRVFQVFHFAFGPQNRPFLVQIRTKPQKTVPSHLLHLMVAENTQKGNPPTGLRTRSCPASYRRSFFSAKPTFCSLPSHPTSTNQAAAIKNSRK